MNKLALFQLRVLQKVMRDNAAIIDIFPFEEESAESKLLFRKGTTGIAPVEDATYIQHSKDRFLKKLARLPLGILIFALGYAAHTMLLRMGVEHVNTCHPAARHENAQSGICNQLYSQIRSLLTVGEVQLDVIWWMIENRADKTKIKAFKKTEAKAKALQKAALKQQQKQNHQYQQKIVDAYIFYLII
ncbi:hypothetical protein B484DRAFT_407409 [Ochromonadaceae sp. CCMP2298]|nr:hypothetical protein B484DRAFT_407409 [Ochromonadaceae sp. CCMP2298]